jgi:hypothetical protein
MNPGLLPERRVLSAQQLRSHVSKPFSWAPEAISQAVLSSTAVDLQTCKLTNATTGQEETLLDLLAFGAPEVSPEYLLLRL